METIVKCLLDSAAPDIDLSRFNYATLAQLLRSEKKL